MKVLIIEDEAPAAQRLNRLLTEYKDIHVLEVLTSVESTVAWLNRNPDPDLIFLDIHLADGLSFEIFNHVQIKCPIIFCTAYDQYALEAFRFNSIDYLLKPVKAESLSKSLEKMRGIKEIFSPVEPMEIANLLKMIKSKETNYKSRFMVKIGTKIRAIKTGDIAYFHSHNKLTLLVTQQGENFPVDYSLDDLIALLDQSLFFHVNRNLIIHIDSAKEIQPYFKGRLKLTLRPPLEEEVIVSSQKTPAFKEWLDQ